MMEYIKLGSLTFWASFVPLLFGVVVATEPLHGLSAIVATVNALTGNVAPALLISAGMAGIGARKAIG